MYTVICYVAQSKTSSRYKGVH